MFVLKVDGLWVGKQFDFFLPFLWGEFASCGLRPRDGVSKGSEAEGRPRSKGWTGEDRGQGGGWDAKLADIHLV